MSLTKCYRVRIKVNKNVGSDTSFPCRDEDFARLILRLGKYSARPVGTRNKAGGAVMARRKILEQTAAGADNKTLLRKNYPFSKESCVVARFILSHLKMSGLPGWCPVEA